MIKIEDFINDTVKVDKKRKPKIYLASKVHNGKILRDFRNKNHDLFECTSTWLDLKCDSYFVLNQKGKLWDLCLQDIKKSDFLILFSSCLTNDHCGALVEVGHAMALSKEVFEVGRSIRTEPSENSDVAFTYHPLYTRLAYNTLDESFDYLVKNTDYWKDEK